MNDKRHLTSVTARFSRAAASYEAHAEIQRAVALKLLGLMCPIKDVRRILEIGCGTGMLTECLLEMFPAARIDALDASESMIRQCRKKLGEQPSLRWHAEDFHDFSGQRPYDLIVSSSCLHWIRPIRAALAKAEAQLAAGGHFVFSLMTRGTLKELHESRFRVAPHKLPLGSLPSTDEVKAGLQALGLRILDEQEEILTMHYRSARELLSVLHEQGLTGGVPSLSATPLTRGEIQRLIADYDKHHRRETRVVATYKPYYIHAVKS